ncbi:DUF6380 family protein [Streptomyces glaucescens]
MRHFGPGASTGTEPDGAADGERGDAVGVRRDAVCRGVHASATAGGRPGGFGDRRGGVCQGRSGGGTRTRVTAGGQGGSPDGACGAAPRGGAADRTRGKRRATLRRAGASQTAAVRSGRFLRRGGRAGEGAR